MLEKPLRIMLLLFYTALLRIVKITLLLVPIQGPITETRDRDENKTTPDRIQTHNN